MIVQQFSLDLLPWTVWVFYHPSRRELPVVIQSLHEGGCTGEVLDEVEEMLSSGVKNTGMTWSNPKTRTSVIVIGRTTNASQFNDTYDHEKGHLAIHISQYEKINPFGEEYQYLAGEIGRKMFIVAKHFLCDHCRREKE